MSNLDVSKLNFKVIAPVAIAGAAVIYFGLSSYAGSQAEKKLDDYLYENRLDSYVSWKSVSSSPFGGTVTIKGLTVESKELIPVELSIEKLVIKNYKDDDDRVSADLYFHEIQPTYPDSDFAKAYNKEIFGPLLLASGQAQVAPYDLSVGWDYRPDDRHLTTQINVDLPNLFAGQVKVDLEGVRDIKSALFLTQIHPALNVLPGIPNELLGMSNRAINELKRDIQSITLNSLDFSFKDQGYLKRANLLEKRYNITPVKITDNAEKEREKLFEKQYKNNYEHCVKEFDSVYKNAKKACKAVIGTWYSQENGFKVAMKPSSKVRLEDFSRLQGSKREQGRFIERLNLDVTTY